MKTFFVTISLLFAFASLNAQIQNKNISDTEYDINDPRNPNCPCHKLQQQAENEYRQYVHKQRTSSQFNIQTQNAKRNIEEINTMNSLTAQIINVENSTQPQKQSLNKISSEFKKKERVVAIKENQKIKVKKLKRGKNFKIKPFRNTVKSASLKNARKRVVCFVWKY